MERFLSVIILFLPFCQILFAQSEDSFWNKLLELHPLSKDTTIIVYNEFIDHSYRSISEVCTPQIFVDTIVVLEPQTLDNAPYLRQEFEAFVNSMKYPDLARRAGIEGSVVLIATIDKSGIPQDVKVKRSNAEIFTVVAPAYLKKTRFRPALINGQPVEVKIAVAISFRLTGLNVKKANIPIDTIVVHKGPCFGPCPSYTITLDKDGGATYFGHYFVARLGKWKASLKKYQFTEIASLIYAIRFFTLRESYTNLATDQSSVTITVRAGNQTKLVTSDPGCYYPLWAIASLVENMTDKLSWERIIE
jgi:TonB family protein